MIRLVKIVGLDCKSDLVDYNELGVRLAMSLVHGKCQLFHPLGIPRARETWV